MSRSFLNSGTLIVTGITYGIIPKLAVPRFVESYVRYKSLLLGEVYLFLLSVFLATESGSRFQSPKSVCTVKSPNFVMAHYFVTAAENFCEALIGF
jgi:hypothetical protein